MSDKLSNYFFNVCVKVLGIIAILLISEYAEAQDDCNCKSGEQITICYYSTDKFCPPDGECRYTLDGDFMINSLSSKLQNPELFGPEGISKCPIVLEVVEDVTTVDYLEQKKCDIMFVGGFTDFEGGQFLPTSVPQSDLTVIKEWSMKCLSNLTIISQVEAEQWGYEFEDLNENPNSPDPQYANFSVFNGTFGKVSSFNQGGSFQGIFVDFPNTGYAIIARDDNSEPTIVLDSLTNDIILGDIGILCNSAGPLSATPNIESESDILACNLFDLGCKIATNSITDLVNICEGEDYTTEAGQILIDQGVYVDSLLTQEGCDSLIYTILDVNVLYDTLFTQNICDDQQYEIIVGNIVYGQSNRIGTELLSSAVGCDSVVHIELYYFQSDTTYLNESICENESFIVNDITYNETINDVIYLQNKDLCDSIIYLDLLVNDNYSIPNQIVLCPSEVYTTAQGTVIAEDSIYIESLLSINGCDSINLINIVFRDSYEEDVFYIGCKGDGYSIDIEGAIYNESNPVGVVPLYSVFGCDSIIYIDLQFREVDTTYLVEAICEGETFMVGSIEYDKTEFLEIALLNQSLCDSIIYLDLIANETYSTQVSIDLCPGEEYVTPEGISITEGSYIELLQSISGCDSLVTIFINNNNEYQVQELYTGCQGDGYSLEIGGTVYDESNTTGLQLLQSTKGCDSSVVISFLYYPIDTTHIAVKLCPYETYEVGGILYSGTLYESIVLSSSNNCDSIILLDLETYDSEEVVLETSYDINLNIFTTLGIPEIDSSIYDWSSDGLLSCNLCPNPSLSLISLPSVLQLDYTDKYNCTYSSSAEMSYRCTPFFPNIINVNNSTSNNNLFKVESLCPFAKYSIHIYDRWGSLVFFSNDQSESWDGRHNYKAVAQGVYIYVMKYEVSGGAEQVVGSLTVLR